MLLSLNTSSIVAGNPAVAGIVKQAFDDIVTWSSQIAEDNIATLTGVINWNIMSNVKAISIYGNTAALSPLIYINAYATAPMISLVTHDDSLGTDPMIKLQAYTTSPAILIDTKAKDNALNITQNGTSGTASLIKIESSTGSSAKLIELISHYQATGIDITTTSLNPAIKITYDGDAPAISLVPSVDVAGSEPLIRIETDSAVPAITIINNQSSHSFLSQTPFSGNHTQSFEVTWRSTLKLTRDSVATELIPVTSNDDYNVGDGLCFMLTNNTRLSAKSVAGTKYVLPVYKYNSNETPAVNSYAPVMKTSILRVYESGGNWHIEEIHDEIGIWNSGFTLNVVADGGYWCIELDSNTIYYYPTLLKENLITFNVNYITYVGSNAGKCITPLEVRAYNTGKMLQIWVAKLNSSGDNIYLYFYLLKWERIN